MKKILSLLLFGFMSNLLTAQCTGNSYYFNYALTNSNCSYSNIVDYCVYAGEYVIISNLQIGASVTLDVDNNRCITVRTGNSSGTLVTSGTSSVSFTATTTAVYVLVNLDCSGCGTLASCNTLSISYTSTPTPTPNQQSCEGAVLVCSNDSFNNNSSGEGCAEELNPPILFVGYWGSCASDAATIGSPTWNANYASTLAACEAAYGVGNCTLNGGTVNCCNFWCTSVQYRYEYYVNSANSNNGCLATGENQSSWYYLNVETGGTLEFDLIPNTSTNDYDFAVWGPYTSTTAAANCAPIEAPIRCTWQAGGGSGGGNTGLDASESDVSEGAFGGNGYVSAINANDDDVYLLMVDNFSASNNGFQLNWTGTAVLGCNSVVLPVELTNFNGYSEGQINKLTWQTNSEMNNSHFELERSEDGLTWQTIAEIDGNGTTSEISNYGFNDFGFRYVVNHYRLTQVDIDGSRQLFNTISIDNRLEAKELVKIINTLGQEVRPDSKGLKIYIYSDGTIVKRMN